MFILFSFFVFRFRDISTGYLMFGKSVLWIVFYD